PPKVEDDVGDEVEVGDQPQQEDDEEDDDEYGITAENIKVFHADELHEIRDIEGI
ncbi:hypothetical protein L195_g064101, partial [Trifolium pratense]